MGKKEGSGSQVPVFEELPVNTDRLTMHELQAVARALTFGRAAGPDGNPVDSGRLQKFRRIGLCPCDSDFEEG